MMHRGMNIATIGLAFSAGGDELEGGREGEEREELRASLMVTKKVWMGRS